MSDGCYERLAETLDRLPNGFPRTQTGIELRILRKIFSEEEAELASWMTHEGQTAAVIAGRAGIQTGEADRLLHGMAKRELIWLNRQEGRATYRLAPFIVGFYESQLSVLDHELSHMVEEYLSQGGAAGIMGPEPALHRVIPTQGTVKTEWILPYEDVRAILMDARSYHLQACICRVQQAELNHPCEFPLETCLSFSSQERALASGDLTREQALDLLAQTEELGLVHTVSNVMQGMGYVCNCCGCCCGILRGINDWGIANSVAKANYYSVIDAEWCSDCGVCVERCQVHAIHEVNGGVQVDKERCIGCGLCVSACTADAAHLERREEAALMAPPLDFGQWEQARLRNRGIENR